MDIGKRIKKLWVRMLNPDFKQYVLDGKNEVVPAFLHKGITYYMFKDPLNVSTGRGLTAMQYYDEMAQRCDVDYLRQHVAANRKTFSNPKGIDVNALVKMNENLDERIELLASLPDNIYKLASVVFFTKNESPYLHNPVTAAEKVEAWKESGDVYSFFLRTPLKDLIPSLQFPKENSANYSQVAEKIDQNHRKLLRTILSDKG